MNDKFRAIRKERGYTWKSLAEASGVFWTTIAKLERGEKRFDGLGAGRYLRICDALGVDPHTFLQDEPQEKVPE